MRRSLLRCLRFCRAWLLTEKCQKPHRQKRRVGAGPIILKSSWVNAAARFGVRRCRVASLRDFLEAYNVKVGPSTSLGVTILTDRSNLASRSNSRWHRVGERFSHL